MLDQLRIMSEKVYCRFHIAQHSKDIELMKLFKFFNCGVVHLRSNSATPRCDFIVQDATSLLNKIIPHFDLYPAEQVGDPAPCEAGEGTPTSFKFKTKRLYLF